METEALGKTEIHTAHHKTSLLKTWLYLVNSLQNCTKFITPQQIACIPGEKGNGTDQQRESLPCRSYHRQSCLKRLQNIPVNSLLRDFWAISTTAMHACEVPPCWRAGRDTGELWQWRWQQHSAARSLWYLAGTLMGHASHFISWTVHRISSQELILLFLFLARVGQNTTLVTRFVIQFFILNLIISLARGVTAFPL